MFFRTFTFQTNEIGSNPKIEKTLQLIPEQQFLLGMITEKIKE